MRLFIAINFRKDTKNRLLEIRDELRSLSDRGNFSLPENLHLTLAFLGECDLNQTATIKSIVESVIFQPFDISINHIGFYKRDGGDIWWAGLQKSEPLLKIQSALTDRLIAAGFDLEKRKYNPHITLGREVITDEQAWEIVPFGETVTSIDLMKSERINGRLTYTKI